MANNSQKDLHRFTPDDLLVIDKYFAEVKNTLLANELFDEWIEFNRLFMQEKNFLAAHSYADEVAKSNGIIFNHSLNKKFWETVW